MPADPNIIGIAIVAQCRTEREAYLCAEAVADARRLFDQWYATRGFDLELALRAMANRFAARRREIKKRKARRG